jgi:uncharacterized MAPEG superfamily protein
MAQNGAGLDQALNKRSWRDWMIFALLGLSVLASLLWTGLLVGTIGLLVVTVAG